jgi:hypothetical protein
MKKLLAIIAVLTLSSVVMFAQKKDRRMSFKSWDNYEITTEKVGVEGTKFVKVWGFGKTVDEAVMAAKRNAVHACLFRGLPGATNVNATPALCKDPNAFDANYDYFCDFFQPGSDYLKYVNLTTDGIPAGQDKRKVKGGYKCAIYVQVMFDNLRRQMETDGIIKKLSSGF